MSAKLFLSPVRDGRGQISNLNFDILTYYSLVRNVTNSSPSPPLIMVKLENVEFQFYLLTLHFSSSNTVMKLESVKFRVRMLELEVELYV